MEEKLYLITAMYFLNGMVCGFLVNREFVRFLKSGYLTEKIYYFFGFAFQLILGFVVAFLIYTLAIKNGFTLTIKF